MSAKGTLFPAPLPWLSHYSFCLAPAGGILLSFAKWQLFFLFFPLRNPQLYLSPKANQGHSSRPQALPLEERNPLLLRSSCFPHCETPQPLADGCQHGEQGEELEQHSPRESGIRGHRKGPILLGSEPGGGLSSLMEPCFLTLQAPLPLPKALMEAASSSLQCSNANTLPEALGTV